MLICRSHEAPQAECPKVAVCCCFNSFVRSRSGASPVAPCMPHARTFNCCSCRENKNNLTRTRLVEESVHKLEIGDLHGRAASMIPALSPWHVLLRFATRWFVFVLPYTQITENTETNTVAGWPLFQVPCMFSSGLNEG